MDDTGYQRVRSHLGHKIRIVLLSWDPNAVYENHASAAIECEDCSVMLDVFQRPTTPTVGVEPALCPWCGIRPIVRHSKTSRRGIAYFIRCDTDFCIGGETHEFETPESAIAEWNDRKEAA